LIEELGEIKGQVIPVRAMKACWEMESIVVLSPHLDTWWRWAVSFTQRPHYPQRKNSWPSEPL